MWAKHTRNQGFTIVELLIVIVVIAILATLTIVAYNGIQNGAKASSLQSDLSQAAKQLDIYKYTNSETYPADQTAAIAAGIKASSGNTITYYNNSSSNSYCLQSTNSSITYSISSTSTSPTVGPCTENSLVGWWKLDGNANDSTSNGNNGVINGATPTTGINGQSYWFDGVSNYISYGNLGTLYSQGTISFWMKADVVENYRNPFTTRYNGGNNAIRFEEYTTPTPLGGFSVSIGNASSSAGQSYLPSTALSPNTWYHVVLVWDKDTNNIIGYLNNVLKFNSPQNVWPVTMPSVAIGNGFNASRFWKGSIDEVRIYNRALSPDEINSLYNLQ